MRETALIPNAHEVFVVDDSDDLFWTVLVNRDSREFVFSHHAEDTLEIGIDREGDYAVARRHDFASRIIRELNQALNRVLLELLKVAFMAAGLDDVLQLFGRMAAARVACCQAEDAKDQRR